MKMKLQLRLAAALLLIALSVQNLQAQSRRYSFGFYIDPQVSWLHSDNKKRFDTHGTMLTVNMGLDAEKFFATRYSIISGVSLNFLGGHVLHNDATTLHSVNSSYALLPGAKVKYRGQYVSVPLGLKFRSIEIGYTTIYASVGIKGNVRLRGYTWVDGTNVLSLEDISKEKTNDHFLPVFGSFFVTAGIEQSLGGESSLQFGLTYSGGITPMIDTQKASDSNVHTSITNHTIGLRIGFVF